jgi:hypothetical protein
MNGQGRRKARNPLRSRYPRNQGKAVEARKREPDPVVEAGQARWREFRETDYEDQIALFLRTLDDPELMDAEMAFEMLNEIFRASAERQERDRFDVPMPMEIQSSHVV